MGDRRFDPIFERVKNAPDRAQAIHSLSDDDVIAALGGATQEGHPLLANLLATEAQNRAHRASQLTSAAGEGIIAMDKDWQVTMQNPAAERLLGWTSAEFVGRDPHEAMHPFCNTPEACHLGSVPPLDFFYQNDDALVMRKDGRTIRVAYTITPMLRAGEVDGGILILRDSSERKRQEEKASQTQDRLATILQTLCEGVLTMDLTGRITYANAAAERILGRAARDITERTYYDPAWDFVTPTGAVLPVTELPFLRVLSTGEGCVGTSLGVRRGDHEIVQLHVDTVPLPNASGEMYALLVSFHELRPWRSGAPEPSWEAGPVRNWRVMHRRRR